MVARLVRAIAAAMLAVAPLLIACAGPGGSAPTATLPEAPSAAPTQEPKGLLFRSGFEEGVQLEPPRLEFRQWRQYLRGGDAGFDWSAAFPARLANFQYLVYDSDAAEPSGLKDFVDTRIETLSGRRGQTTRALYQEVRRRGGAATQNDFILFDWDTSRTQGYLRYWVKLQPDLERIMPSPGMWRLLTEWKETPSLPGHLLDFQYRWGFYVSRVAQPQFSGLAWKLEASRTEPNVPGFSTDWAKWNYSVAVPKGEWFSLEVEWLNHQENGRLAVRVNGQAIAEHKGQTQRAQGQGKLYVFMVYTGSESTDIGPAYQWVDDVELWETPPGAP